MAASAVELVWLRSWGGELLYFVSYVPVPFEIIHVYVSLIVYYKINFKHINTNIVDAKYLDLNFFSPDLILWKKNQI